MPRLLRKEDANSERKLLSVDLYRFMDLSLRITLSYKMQKFYLNAKRASM